MHAVRRELVEAQAERIGLPLWPIDLPWPCSNDVYEDLMSGTVRRALAERASAIAFGDLFLEDIREYRERQLIGTGLEPLFPLWRLPTNDLAREMIGAGVKSRVTCVDPKKLAAHLPAANSTQTFWTSCRLQSIPAARMASFTHSSTTRRCSLARFRLGMARSSSAKGSCSPMCWGSSRRRGIVSAAQPCGLNLWSL